MEVALGALGWPPESFWQASYAELTAAYVGHCKAKGLGPYAQAPGRFSGAEVRRLTAEMAVLKGRFPDGAANGALRRALKGRGHARGDR